jgi:hypothetical protein
MIIFTRKHLFGSIALFLLTSCNRIDSILYAPPVTPEDFLHTQPWVQIKLGSVEFILCQPSSTIIVHFLGLFTLFAGYRFLANLNNQRVRLAWGVGLLLAGAGAILAGTSYQAFGYEIKCVGRESCSWTSCWEIIYLWFTSFAFNAFLVGSAFTSKKQEYRKAMIAYAMVNSISYSALLLYGVLLPYRSLMSFEFMVLSAVPTLFLLIGFHHYQFRKHKNNSDRILRNVWLIIIPVALAYSIWSGMNLTQILWEKGIWFSENDVLHIGMIFWVFYVIRFLSPDLSDPKQS